MAKKICEKKYKMFEQKGSQYLIIILLLGLTINGAKAAVGFLFANSSFWMRIVKIH